MKWPSIVAGVILVALVGFGWYLHRQIDAIMSQPEVQLTATPYTPIAADGPSREIDLGYARFAIPADIPGSLVRYDEIGGFAGLALDGKPAALTFGLPVSSADPHAQRMLETASSLVGHRVKSLPEVLLLAIHTRPITIWDVPRLGYKGSVATMAFAHTKVALLSGAKSIRLYETRDLTLWIQDRDRAVFAHLCDHRQGTEQLFIIDSSQIDLDRLLAHVIPTFEFRTRATDSDGFKAELEATGIPILKLPPPNSDSAGQPLTGEQLIDAIRERRAKRKLSNPSDRPNN